MTKAFLFPGQGAQTVGMGRELSQHPQVLQRFAQASDILGYDLLAICLNGPVERLNATDISQPAIFVISLAALDVLLATNPAAADGVATTAGLSLGEYTALVYAGALSFEDGLKVVKIRGEAMQKAAEATPSAMVSILGIEAPEIESLLAECRQDSTLQIANRLCPGNTVVAGTIAAIDRLCQMAETRGLRTVRLAVAGAFHTHLMSPADKTLAAALESVIFQTPRLPIWSNVDAQPHTDPQEIRALLVKQVLSPVLWEETMRGMLASGIDKFYEIGPGRVLAGLLKRVHRKAEIENYQAI